MKVRLTILALALSACGGSPQPGDPGYSYNLSGEYAGEIAADDGSVFEAIFQLETLPGGEIQGTMSISDPMSISGEVSGLIIGAEAMIELTYYIADAGCGGAAEGTAVVEEGGVGAAGTLEITLDECGGGPSSMTITMTRN